VYTSNKHGKQYVTHDFSIYIQSLHNNSIAVIGIKCFVSNKIVTGTEAFNC